MSENNLEQQNIEKDKSKQDELSTKQLAMWEKVIGLASPIISYYENKLTKHTAPIAKSAVWGLIIIIGLIILSSSILVAFDKIDKSNFTFIIGSVLGYLFSSAKVILNYKNSE